MSEERAHTHSCRGGKYYGLDKCCAGLWNPIRDQDPANSIYWPNAKEIEILSQEGPRYIEASEFGTSLRICDVHKETFFNRVFKREHKLLLPTCQYVQTQASRLVAGASKVVCRIFGAVRQTQADVSRLDRYFHRLAGCILRPPRSDSSAMDARGPLYSRVGHSFATSSADHRICCAACIVPTLTLASTATSLTLSCW